MYTQPLYHNEATQYFLIWVWIAVLLQIERGGAYLQLLLEKGGLNREGGLLERGAK